MSAQNGVKEGLAGVRLATGCANGRIARSAALCLAMLAAAGFQLPDASRAARAQRQFEAGSWELVGQVESDLLWDPWFLRLADERIFVFDGGERVIKVFALDGRPEARLGRAGQGPGEFQNPVDMQVGPDGSVWVLDPLQARVTVFRPDGTFARMFSLGRSSGHRLLVFADSSFWVLGSATADSLGTRHDASGNELGTIPAPGVLDRVGLLARESSVEMFADGTRAVVAFLYADPLLLLDKRYPEEARVVRGIEVEPFPEVLRWETPYGVASRVHPEARVTHVSVATDGDTILSLYRGRSEHGREVLDLYSGATGAYVGSRRLPAEAESSTTWMDADGGVVALLLRDPVPTVLLVRWVSPSSQPD